MKKPFFSIVLLTFNRSKDLQVAIKSILLQDFKNFELIILDDHSTDNTQKIINSFKDKRIRYFRQKKNVGWIPNLKKGLSLAKGNYILLHGDDDYMLYNTTLNDVHKLLQEKTYGVIRLSYIYRKPKGEGIFDYLRNKFLPGDAVLKKYEKAEAILNYMQNIDLFFITGIVIKNKRGLAQKIIQSEFMPWVRIIYDALLEDGGYYSMKTNFVAAWSQQLNSPAYHCIKGKLPFEEYFNEIKKIGGNEYYKKVLARELDISVKFFGSIKFKSDNRNLLIYAGRIRELSRAYTFSPVFWFLLISAYLAPKLVLKYMRDFYIWKITKDTKNIKNYSIIYKDFVKRENLLSTSV